MTSNIDKFIAEVTDRLAANNGKIPAPLYFEIGKLCGMTCKQVVEAKKEKFSDKIRNATRTTSVKPVKAAKKAVVKKVKKVKTVSDEPAALTKKQKKAFAAADESTGVVEDTPNSFVWIASPEEIANPADLHETAY